MERRRICFGATWNHKQSNATIRAWPIGKRNATRTRTQTRTPALSHGQKGSPTSSMAMTVKYKNPTWYRTKHNTTHTTQHNSQLLGPSLTEVSWPGLGSANGQSCCALGQKQHQHQLSFSLSMCVCVYFRVGVHMFLANNACDYGPASWFWPAL